MFAPFLKRSVGIVGTEKNALLEINLSWTILNSRFDNNGFIRLNCTLGHSLFFSPITVVRPTQIFGIFKKKNKRNDVVQPFFT